MVGAYHWGSGTNLHQPHCVPVHLWEHEFVQVCMEVRGQCRVSYVALHLVFWNRVSLQLQSLTFWLDYLVHQPQESSLCALGTGIRGTCHHASLFMWLLGIQTQALMLSWKAVGKQTGLPLHPFQFDFGCGKSSKSHQEQDGSSFPDPANYHRSDDRRTASLPSKFLLLTMLKNYLQKWSHYVSASISLTVIAVLLILFLLRCVRAWFSLGVFWCRLWCCDLSVKQPP